MSGDETLDKILEKALGPGASVAGFLPAQHLEDCPSARAAGPQGFATCTGTTVVLGLYHDPARPELDWWDEDGGTPGDRILRDIIRELSPWLLPAYGITSRDIPCRCMTAASTLRTQRSWPVPGASGKTTW